MNGSDEDEMEDATFCAFCQMTHWFSDEDETNSPWQQWQCQECGNWNDKATD
jgi:hypothetical protein